MVGYGGENKEVNKEKNERGQTSQTDLRQVSVSTSNKVLCVKLSDMIAVVQFLVQRL